MYAVSELIKKTKELKGYFDEEEDLVTLSNYMLNDKAFYCEWDNQVYANEEDFRDAYPEGTRGSDCFVKCVALFNDNGDCEWFNFNEKKYETVLNLFKDIDNMIEVFNRNDKSYLTKKSLNNLVFTLEDMCKENQGLQLQ